jgi:hypothetical protein
MHEAAAATLNGPMPTWLRSSRMLRAGTSCAELRPRGRDSWTEPLPGVSARPDPPYAYLQCSESYKTAARNVPRRWDGQCPEKERPAM